jgi:hypothetical protein
MLYAWKVDEGAAARKPVDQPGAPFARNNTLLSLVFRSDAVGHQFHSSWAVEESDWFLVPGL